MGCRLTGVATLKAAETETEAGKAAVVEAQLGVADSAARPGS